MELNNLKMPNVNPFEYPSVKCTCGNEIFVPGVIFKDIPGVALGERENVHVPIKIFYCSKCGTLSPADKEMLSKYDASNNNKSITHNDTRHNMDKVDIII